MKKPTEYRKWLVSLSQIERLQHERDFHQNVMFFLAWIVTLVICSLPGIITGNDVITLTIPLTVMLGLAWFGWTETRVAPKRHAARLQRDQEARKALGVDEQDKEILVQALKKPMVSVKVKKSG